MLSRLRLPASLWTLHPREEALPAPMYFLLVTPRALPVDVSVFQTTGKRLRVPQDRRHLSPPGQVSCTLENSTHSAVPCPSQAWLLSRKRWRSQRRQTCRQQRALLLARAPVLALCSVTQSQSRGCRVMGPWETRGQRAPLGLRRSLARKHKGPGLGAGLSGGAQPLCTLLSVTVPRAACVPRMCMASAPPTLLTLQHTTQNLIGATGHLHVLHCAEETGTLTCMSPTPPRVQRTPGST